jgi:hypothetical protein
MMSQMDLTNDDNERVPAMVFGPFCFGFFLALGMESGVGLSVEQRVGDWPGTTEDSSVVASLLASGRTVKNF